MAKMYYNGDINEGSLKEKTIAISSLLHDLCKMNFYTVEYRNAKNEKGV